MTNIIEKAKEENLLQFFDFMSGIFTFTQEDFFKHKNDILRFKNAFDNFVIMVEDIDFYKEGCQYLENSKAPFVYFMIDKESL